MTKKILTVAALALAFAAGAATKTVTLSAPASVTAKGGWRVCLMPNSDVTTTPTALVGVSMFCAASPEGVTECSENREQTGAPPQAWIDFLNERLTAWKTAKGY